MQRNHQHGRKLCHLKFRSNARVFVWKSHLSLLIQASFIAISKDVLFVLEVWVERIQQENRKKRSKQDKGINQYSCFRRMRLKPSVSCMGIYETISHVNTNQVWLHINFPSSRIFQFLALLRFVGSTCEATYQKLPVCRNAFSFSFSFSCT